MRRISPIHPRARRERPADVRPAAPGLAARLHRHPYDETWYVQEGNVTFQAGEDRQQAGPGDIVIVPGDVPHKFTNDGPGTSKLVCVHASPTFITEWLE